MRCGRCGRADAMRPSSRTTNPSPTTINCQASRCLPVPVFPRAQQTCKRPGESTEQSPQYPLPLLPPTPTTKLTLLPPATFLARSTMSVQRLV